jgi:transposase
MTDVSPGLATRLGQSAATVRSAIATRDANIVRAAAAGASLRQIAELVGMSTMSVQRIVARARADADQ